jgi:hypothetical protein
MQLMSIDHQNSGRKSHVSSVPFNPPIQDGQGNSLVKSSVWASPQPTKQHIKDLLAKPRSNSLLGIMNEELQKSSSDHMTPKHYAKSMSTATPVSGKKLSFSPQSAQPSCLISATPSSSFSLGAFIPHDDNNNNELKAAKSSWASSKPATKNVPALSSNTQVKSFADIQKEEIDNRKKEDHMCHLGGNKWFVQQRDRAASIGEIQQKEQEEADWLMLVEEQKRIEKEIERERKVKAKQDKMKKQNKQRQKKPATNNERGKPKPSKSEKVANKHDVQI